MDFLHKNLNSELHSKHKYKYEIVGDDETKFVMIGGDPTEIDIKLSNLIRQPRKFVCLNDNIDYKLGNEASELKRIIRKFYSSLYPLKSSFELAEKRADEFSSSSHKLRRANFLAGGSAKPDADYLRTEPSESDEAELKPLFKFNFRDNYDRFFFNLIFFIIVILFVIYVFKKCILLVLVPFLKAYLFSTSKPAGARTKARVKTKKREHKISNALRQKMKNELSDDSNETDESDSDDMQRKSSKDAVLLPSASTGIVMRPKKSTSFRKTSKKSNISHV